jgi:hypothetical protein
MLEASELEQLACVRDVLNEFKQVLGDDPGLFDLVKGVYIGSLLESLERDKVSDKEAILMFSGGGKRARQVEMREFTRSLIKRKFEEE